MFGILKVVFWAVWVCLNLYICLHYVYWSLFSLSQSVSDFTISGCLSRLFFCVHLTVSAALYLCQSLLFCVRLCVFLSLISNLCLWPLLPLSWLFNKIFKIAACQTYSFLGDPFQLLTTSQRARPEVTPPSYYLLDLKWPHPVIWQTCSSRSDPTQLLFVRPEVTPSSYLTAMLVLKWPHPVIIC